MHRKSGRLDGDALALSGYFTDVIRIGSVAVSPVLCCIRNPRSRLFADIEFLSKARVFASFGGPCQTTPFPRMTTRLRHRPQTEEEDASALKLGPGTHLSYSDARTVSEECVPGAQSSIMLVVS